MAGPRTSGDRAAGRPCRCPAQRLSTGWGIASDTSYSVPLGASAQRISSMSALPAGRTTTVSVTGSTGRRSWQRGPTTAASEMAAAASSAYGPYGRDRQGR